MSVRVLRFHLITSLCIALFWSAFAIYWLVKGNALLASIEGVMAVFFGVLSLIWFRRYRSAKRNVIFYLHLS